MIMTDTSNWNFCHSPVEAKVWRRKAGNGEYMARIDMYLGKLRWVVLCDSRDGAFVIAGGEVWLPRGTHKVSALIKDTKKHCEAMLKKAVKEQLGKTT